MLSRFRWDKVNLLCFGTSNSNRMVCVNGEYSSHSSGSSFKSTKGKRILALVSNRIQSASFLLVTKVQKQKPKLLNSFLFNLQDSNTLGDHSNTHLMSSSSHHKGKFTHTNQGQLSRSFVSNHFQNFTVL